MIIVSIGMSGFAKFSGVWLRLPHAQMLSAVPQSDF